MSLNLSGAQISQQCAVVSAQLSMNGGLWSGKRGTTALNTEQGDFMQLDQRTQSTKAAAQSRL